MTGQKQVWIDVDDQAIGTRPFSPKGQGTMHVASISREPPMGANESNIYETQIQYRYRTRTVERSAAGRLRKSFATLGCYYY